MRKFLRSRLVVVPAFAPVMARLRARYTVSAASSKSTPWQVLVFTLLSARTRDEQTEKVFQILIRKFPTPQALAQAQLLDVQRILRHIGLYKNKSKQLIALAKTIHTQYLGQVPRRLTELISLPGVGVKTAKCVLVYAFDQPAIPVDTHVHRIANRLGWVKERTPERTGQALEQVVPKTYWRDVNRVMVQFGREICLPRKPDCPNCPVAKWCAYPDKTPRG